MDSAYRIRAARADDSDVEALRRMRWAMFEDMGEAPPEERTAFDAAARRFVEAHLRAGTLRAWIVETQDGEAVGGGCLQLRPVLPGPGAVGGEPDGYLLSVWTHAQHRRRGLARRLMETMVGWCRERGIRRIALHASPDGRHVYESLGFRPTNEMRLTLDAE